MRLSGVALRFVGAAAVICLVVLLAPAACDHAACTQTSAAATPPRPNVILIVADDLDTEVFRRSSLDGPWVTRGMNFTNALVTTSLCCPSRASILRGQYSHNTGLVYNSDNEPGGGAAYFRNSGLDRATMATRLRAGGYTTWFGGKYFNTYAAAGGNRGYVPPGWSSWQAYLNATSANVNGRRVSFTQHYTDWLTQRAVRFIRSRQNVKQPFFMEIAPNDTHEPLLIPARHASAYPTAPLPRPPSFGEADVSDKPAWVRRLPRLSASKVQEYTVRHRTRMRSALTLEDLSRRVLTALSRTHKLGNTYVIFTSDNGYHMGLHRIDMRKWTPYTEANEVPFVVRGPHVPARPVGQLAANIDIAPTVLNLARIPVPTWMDGRSLRPFFDGTPPARWRTGLLIEGATNCPNCTPPVRPSYAGVRRLTKVYVRYGTGEQEYYDLARDPYQLNNRPGAAPPAMKAQLAHLKVCKGAGCRAAENGFR